MRGAPLTREPGQLDLRPSPFLLLGAAAATVAVGLAAEAVSRSAVAPTDVTLDLITGWAVVLSGLDAWRQRPESRVGLLLLASGLTWFLGNLIVSGVASVAFVGAALLMLHRAPIFQAVLTYPTGRSSGRAEAIAIGAVYVYALVDPFVASEIPTLAVAVGLVVMTVRSWRAESGPRRAARRVSVVAAVVLACTLTAGSLDRLWGVGPGVEDLLLWLYEGALIFTALLLAVDLHRRRWSEVTLTRLVVDLGDANEVSAVRARLATALGDPSLRVAFFIPEDGLLVDERGDPIHPPDRGDDRTVTTVFEGGEPIALLMHDPSVLRDPDLMEEVTAAARLALANVRLRAEVRRHVNEVAASRRRIVDAGEAERRRLLRELEDGVERELEEAAVLLATARRAGLPAAGAADVVEAAEQELQRSREEVAGLAAGLHPPLLARGGLADAVAALGARSNPPASVRVTAGPLPAAVEAAVYFVCAEALTNATKHARATRVDVAVSDLDGSVVVEVTDDGIGGAETSLGSGLSGIADRVEALGGWSSVSRPVGGGTSVRASIPVRADAAAEPTSP